MTCKNDTQEKRSSNDQQIGQKLEREIIVEVTNLPLAVPDIKLHRCLYFMKVPQRSSQKLSTISRFIHSLVYNNKPSQNLVA